MEERYLDINRANWNDRLASHIASAFYDLPGFLAGKSSLDDIVLQLLGDINGKTVLHLQCHFGQDSISMARLGATVTGIDLSDKAIAKAKELALETNADAGFICCDVYSTRQHISESFDIVFSSYGTIGWLPDLEKWAGVIAQSLKPGGRFVFAEFHPVVWMFDDDFSNVQYSYFKTDPIIEHQDYTYAGSGTVKHATSVSWNHALSDVLTTLLRNGLRLQAFCEYDYSPYACFRHIEEFAPGKFRIKHMGNKLPMVYGLVAIKL